MARKLTNEERRRMAALLGAIRNDLAEMRALLERRLEQRGT